mmetsp:Transcript_62147/g.126560  ORF Transcript_62147/g.126560 Transcript_62147/m.126560 type:complete len:258 (-) Transcript_62147:877-1650(-)
MGKSLLRGATEPKGKVRNGSEEGNQKATAVERPDQVVDRFQRCQGQRSPDRRQETHRNQDGGLQVLREGNKNQDVFEGGTRQGGKAHAGRGSQEGHQRMDRRDHRETHRDGGGTRPGGRAIGSREGKENQQEPHRRVQSLSGDAQVPSHEARGDHETRQQRRSQRRGRRSHQGRPRLLHRVLRGRRLPAGLRRGLFLRGPGSRRAAGRQRRSGHAGLGREGKKTPRSPTPTRTSPAAPARAARRDPKSPRRGPRPPR